MDMLRSLIYFLRRLINDEKHIINRTDKEYEKWDEGLRRYEATVN